MKTSTAFAILAFLAASSNAIPISRREDGDCPCELLDPSNSVNKAHSIHNDNANLLPSKVNSGQAGTLTSPHEDKPVTLHVPQGSVIDTLNPQSSNTESEAPAKPADDSEAFGSQPRPAFRAARPAKSSGNAVDEADDMMDGADINDALPEDEASAQSNKGDFKAESVDDEANEGPEEKPAEGGVQDGVEQGVQALGVGSGSVDPAFNNITNPPPSSNESGSNPITQVDDAVSEQTGNNTENHVDNLTSNPVGHTGDTATPIADSKVKPTTDGPLSSAPEVLVPGSGPTVNDAAHGPVSSTADMVIPGTGSTVNDAADSPISSAPEVLAPGSGAAVNDAADRPVSSTADKVIPTDNSKVKTTTDSPLSSAPEVLVPGSGPTVNDAAHGPVSSTAEQVIPGTGSTVNDAADGPTTHAANGVVPGSGPAVQQAASHLDGGSDHSLPTGLSSPGNSLSGVPNMDINVALRPPQDQSASAQSTEPQPEAESGSLSPLSANSVQPLTGGLTGLVGVAGPITGQLQNGQLGNSVRPASVNGVASPVTGQVQNGQLGNAVRPVGSSILGGAPKKLLVTGNLLGSPRPLTSGNGVNSLASGAQGVPVVNTLAQPQGNPIGPNTVNGLPVINTLSQPQGSPLGTNTVGGLPVISLLNRPQEEQSIEDAVSDEVEPETFDGGRTKFLASKVRPTADNVDEDIKDAPGALDDGPNGAIDQATEDLAKEDIEACRDCVDKAVDPATSRVSDVSELVQSDPLKVEPTVDTANRRVATANDVVQSDPLHVKPAVESPDSASPISYQCATAPLTKMPSNTTPCLTNWGGRVGEEADVCITQDQLERRPDYTMACPEEMQDHLGDNLNLLHRDDNDTEWDMLSRDVVNQYVRLCMVVNGL